MTSFFIVMQGGIMRTLHGAVWLWMVFLGVCLSCGRHTGRTDAYLRADSLNRTAYAMRYRDLDASAQAAREAFRLAAGNSDLRAEALNSEAFCAFMRRISNMLPGCTVRRLEKVIMNRVPDS